MAPATMRPRPRLLLIALLAGTAGLAASALAAAGGDGQPDRFALQPPAPGDRWAYAVSSLDGSPVVPPDSPFDGWALARVEVERGAAETLLDRDGMPRDAQPLRSRWTYVREDSDVERIVTFHVDGARTVAATAWYDMGGYSTTQVILPTNQTIGDTEAEMNVVNLTRYDQEAPCGHWSSLQLDGELEGGVDVGGDCLGSGPFQVVSADGLLVVQRHAPAGMVQVAFSDDVPVPMQVLQPARWNASQVVVWDLLAFERGEPAPAAERAPHGPADPVSFAPREAWGPGDPAIAHPFPLSEAYALAVASGPMAGFLSDPQAYLQSASFREQVDDMPSLLDPSARRHSYVWTLQASDGPSAVKVEVARTYRSPAAQDDAAALWRGLPVPPTDTVEAVEADGGPFPTADQLPVEIPTVDSVLRRWSAYAPDAAQPNAWGFAIECSDDACSAAATTVTAGRDFRHREDQVVGMSSVVLFRRSADLLSVDGSGATEQHEVASSTSYKHVHVGPLVVQDDGRPPAYVASAGVTGLPAWGVGLAAGGAIALLAGAGLAAKALVGLWHRPASEHPVRAQLLLLLEAEPGLHHQEIMRRLGRGNSVVAHHLRALEREGRVASRAGPRYRCYFLAGQDPRKAAVAGLVKTGLAAGILGRLSEGPATGQELAEHLGVAPSSVAFHVRRFEEAGLVQATRVGRTVRLQATPLGLSAAV